MTPQEARATALSLRRRIETVGRMSGDNPALVRIATDGNGDQVAFWYVGGKAMEFNLSEAQRKLDEIVNAFGPAVLRSRSGKI